MSKNSDQQEFDKLMEEIMGTSPNSSSKTLESKVPTNTQMSDSKVEAEYQKLANELENNDVTSDLINDTKAEKKYREQLIKEGNQTMKELELNIQEKEQEIKKNQQKFNALSKASKPSSTKSTLSKASSVLSTNSSDKIKSNIKNLQLQDSWIELGNDSTNEKTRSTSAPSNKSTVSEKPSSSDKQAQQEQKEQLVQSPRFLKRLLQNAVKGIKVVGGKLGAIPQVIKNTIGSNLSKKDDKYQDISKTRPRSSASLNTSVSIEKIQSEKGQKYLKEFQNSVKKDLLKEYKESVKNKNNFKPKNYKLTIEKLEKEREELKEQRKNYKMNVDILKKYDLDIKNKFLESVYQKENITKDDLTLMYKLKSPKISHNSTFNKIKKHLSNIDPDELINHLGFIKQTLEKQNSEKKLNFYDRALLGIDFKKVLSQNNKKHNSKQSLLAESISSKSTKSLEQENQKSLKEIKEEAIKEMNKKNENNIEQNNVKNQASRYSAQNLQNDETSYPKAKDKNQAGWFNKEDLKNIATELQVEKEIGRQRSNSTPNMIKTSHVKKEEYRQKNNSNNNLGRGG